MDSGKRGKNAKKESQSRNEEEQKDGKCQRTSNWKPVSFDSLTCHTQQIFPRQFAGVGVFIAHNMCQNARLSHKAFCDLANIHQENSDKQYLLDLFWHGSAVMVCKNSIDPCVKGVTNQMESIMSMEHIHRLIGNLRCNPLQHYPNMKGIICEHGRLEYIAPNFLAGIHAKNIGFGKEEFFSEINSHAATWSRCQLGVHAMKAVTRSLTLGLQCNKDFYMQSQTKINHLGNTLHLGARLALPQDSLVFTGKIGGGFMDIGISFNILCDVKFGMVVYAPLADLSRKYVKCGLKICAPDENMEVRLAVDSLHQVAIDARKKLDALPVTLMLTTTFGVNGNYPGNYKVGFGIESSI